MDPLWLNFVSGLAGVQFIHRYLAFAILAIVGLLWVKVRKTETGTNLVRAVNMVVLLVIIQFVLGVVTLLSGAEKNMAIMHQVGAILLFSCSTFLVHSTSK